MHQVVYTSLHGLAQPSVRSTQALTGDCLVWLCMQRDIAAWCRKCIACQMAKVQTHVHAPIHIISEQEFPFSHIHGDIVGPLPPFQRFSYLLTSRQIYLLACGNSVSWCDC